MAGYEYSRWKAAQWRRRGVRYAARRRGGFGKTVGAEPPGRLDRLENPRRLSRLRKSGKSGNGKALRKLLLAMVAVELVIGAGGICAGDGRFRLLRREEACVVEWIEAGSAGSGESEEIYGVRFKPDTLELQLYHRQEKIVP